MSLGPLFGLVFVNLQHYNDIYFRLRFYLPEVLLTRGMSTAFHYVSSIRTMSDTRIIED
jgi:hypothetical protein